MGKKFAKKVAFVQKVVVLHPTEDKILILRRNSKDKSRPSDIDVPGGSVHEGEPHDAALRREVLEEAGLQIEDIKPLIVESEVEKDDYFLFVGYRARALADDVVTDSDEHEGYEWISIEDFSRKYPEHILMELVERLD